MAERTKRGEEDRKQEDEQVTGEPVAATANQPGTQGGTTTRDKGVTPANDDRRDGQGAERE